MLPNHPTVCYLLFVRLHFPKSPIYTFDFFNTHHTLTFKEIDSFASQGKLSSTSDKLVGYQYPQCSICLKEFQSCNHLCSNCRFKLDVLGNQPCPACNRANFLLVSDDNLVHSLLAILSFPFLFKNSNSSFTLNSFPFLSLFVLTSFSGCRKHWRRY